MIIPYLFKTSTKSIAGKERETALANFLSGRAGGGGSSIEGTQSLSSSVAGTGGDNSSPTGGRSVSGGNRSSPASVAKKDGVRHGGVPSVGGDGDTLPASSQTSKRSGRPSQGGTGKSQGGTRKSQGGTRKSQGASRGGSTDGDDDEDLLSLLSGGDSPNVSSRPSSSSTSGGSRRGGRSSSLGTRKSQSASLGSTDDDEDVTGGSRRSGGRYSSRHRAPHGSRASALASSDDDVDEDDIMAFLSGGVDNAPLSPRCKSCHRVLLCVKWIFLLIETTKFFKNIQKLFTIIFECHKIIVNSFSFLFLRIKRKHKCVCKNVYFTEYC